MYVCLKVAPYSCVLPFTVRFSFTLGHSSLQRSAKLPFPHRGTFRWQRRLAREPRSDSVPLVLGTPG